MSMIQTELLHASEKHVKGFDGLVNKMKEVTFLVDPYMRPVEGRDYEHDLMSWIDDSLVKFNNKETFRAEILIQGGKKLVIEPGVTKLYTNLEEAETDECKLLAIALATAKLELIKETISDVYPSLGEEAKTYIFYLDKLKDEILEIEDVGNHRDSDKLAILTPVVMRRFALVITLLLVACSTAVEARAANQNLLMDGSSAKQISYYAPKAPDYLPVRFTDSCENHDDRFIPAFEPSKDELRYNEDFDVAIFNATGKQVSPWYSVTPQEESICVNTDDTVDLSFMFAEVNKHGGHAWIPTVWRYSKGGVEIAKGTVEPGQ